MNSRICLAVAFAFFTVSAVRAQETSPQNMPKNCPMHAKNSGDKARADSAMGFDQSKTTHHFLLTKDGGAIEVSANDPSDSASRDQVARTCHTSPKCSLTEISTFPCSSMTRPRPASRT